MPYSCIQRYVGASLSARNLAKPPLTAHLSPMIELSSRLSTALTASLQPDAYRDDESF